MQLVFVLLWTSLASIVPSKQDEGYFGGRGGASATRSPSFSSRSRRSGWGGSSDSSSLGRWFTSSRTSPTNSGTRNSKYIPPEPQESFNKKFRESVFSATSNGLIKTDPDTYVARNGRTYFNHDEIIYYKGEEKDGGFNLGTSIVSFLKLIAILILISLGMFIFALCLSAYVAAINPNMARCELRGLTQNDLYRLGASQIQPWSRRMTQNSTPIQYPICPPDPQTRIIRSSVPLSRRSPSPEQANHTNSMATCIGPSSRRTPSPDQAGRIEGQDPLPIYIDQPPVRSPSPSPAENVAYDDPPPMYIASPPSYEDCVSQK